MESIKLEKSDGTSEKVEIIATFKIDKFNNQDYVIYKSNNHYFGARYIDRGDKTELDTDLTNEEKDKLSIIFEKFHNGGIM